MSKRRKIPPDEAPSWPPRKRDWKKGTYQVGVYLRTPDESTLTMCTMDRPALPRSVEHAIAAMTVSLDETDDARRARVRMILGVLGLVPHNKPVSDRDLDRVVDAVFGKKRAA